MQSAVRFAEFWNGAGRQTTATHWGMTQGFAYDTAGRLASKTIGGVMPVSYEYDAAGNVVKLAYPDGWYMRWRYDALNRVVRGCENATDAACAGEKMTKTQGAGRMAP